MAINKAGIGIVEEVLLNYLQPKIVDSILEDLAAKGGVKIEIDEETIESLLRKRVDPHINDIKKLLDDYGKKVTLDADSINRIADIVQEMSNTISDALSSCADDINFDIDNEVDEAVEERLRDKRDEQTGRGLDRNVRDLIVFLFQIDFKKYKDLKEVPQQVKNDIKQHLTDTIISDLFDNT